MESWISGDVRETIWVRDDAWPEDAAFEVRKVLTGQDDEEIIELTFSQGDGKGEGLTDKAQFLPQRAGNAAVAVMVVGCRGEVFTDPHTRKPLDFSGDPEQRYHNILKVPRRVIRWLDATLGDLNPNPTAAETPLPKSIADVTKKDSTRRSTLRSVN